MDLISQVEPEVKLRTKASAFCKDSTDKNFVAHLSTSDRRLLLISTLSLFLRRARHGIAVTQDDLSRLSVYGDPPRNRGKCLGVAA